MRRAGPEDDHFFHVEITVAAAIGTPEGRILGLNVVDVTLGFSASMERPPKDATDARINAALMGNISPVIAAIQTVLTQIGFAALGTVADPMTGRSTPTGEFGLSTPVTVHLSMPAPEPRRSQ